MASCRAQVDRSPLRESLAPTSFAPSYCHNRRVIVDNRSRDVLRDEVTTFSPVHDVIFVQGPAGSLVDTAKKVLTNRILLSWNLTGS